MKVLSDTMRPSLPGPETRFTWIVWIDEIVTGVTPSRIKVIRVPFQPGARTAWHAHPLGQTLHLMSGLGRVQKKGEAPREIRPAIGYSSHQERCTGTALHPGTQWCTLRCTKETRRVSMQSGEKT